MLAILMIAALSAAPTPAIRVEGAGAAELTYALSQHSPAIAARARTRISQDFNGAPISGKPAIKTVKADAVSCDGARTCRVSYGRRKIRLKGDDAAFLITALTHAGVPETAGTRSARAIICTVDDAKAQSTPATGNDIAGFACVMTKGG